MAGYFLTSAENQFYIEAKRIYEPANRVDEWEVLEMVMNDIEINFDQLSDRNKFMIYNKLSRG
jgi:hypothetical protein